MRIRLSPLVGLFLLLCGAGLPTHAALPTDARSGLPTLAPLIRDVTPAVVNISVLTRAPELNPLMRDPFFRRFFELPDRPSRPQQSAGSGVIADAAKGYVLTNYHVIKDAQQVLVTLKDRRSFEASLVGADPATDIAVLKIDPDRLSALKFGDSDTLNVGDFVIAIGNPFGLGQTVTSGIVSALGRTGINLEGYEDFIQTDAPINPGNSGGALVNLKGELIGINTAIIGPAGGNVGIGFAVPANMARAVMGQIIKYGEVKRGRLGLGMQDLTPDLARSLGTGAEEGALITGVEAGSPAEKAGMRKGDVVTRLNGRPVRGSADLRNKLGLTPAGERVELRLLRDGKPRTVQARIAQPHQAPAQGQSIQQLAGLAVANIERGHPLYGQVEGVLVAAVEQGSPAHYYGLRTGDVILAVNRKRLRSSAEFVAALKGAEPPLILNLLRGDFRITLLIR
jgi:serine protease Do/serine protease DegQ